MMDGVGWGGERGKGGGKGWYCKPWLGGGDGRGMVVRVRASPPPLPSPSPPNSLSFFPSLTISPSPIGLIPPPPLPLPYFFTKSIFGLFYPWFYPEYSRCDRSVPTKFELLMVQKHHRPHPESEPSMQKSLINAIGRQLVADFHPAVKNVASASQNLLRSFQNLSHHFYAYTAALYALGYSSTNSEEFEVREQSRLLQTATEVLKKVHLEQNEWMDYFTAMTLTINQNSKTEKERLKALLNGFSERERQLTKSISKGQQMPHTLTSFYETELEAMRDQQVQRYRFFADKHLELLRRYREWMKFSLVLLDRELNLADRTERQSGGGVETKNGRAESDRSSNKRDNLEETKREGEECQKGRRKTREIPSLKAAEGGAKTEEAKVGEERVGADSAKKFGTEDGLPAGRRRDFPVKLFRPTPIVPTTKHRHSVADGMLLRDSQVWKTVPKVDDGKDVQRVGGRGERNATREDERKRREGGDAGERLRHFYDDTPTGSAECQQQQNGRVALVEHEQLGSDDSANRRVGQCKIHRTQNGNQIQCLSNANLTRQQSILNAERVQFHIGTGHCAVNPSVEQCHARGESQDSLGSSGTGRTHRHMSAIFAPTDYGRQIECTTSFSAQGDNQLSLEVGERVLLVKSGTRGWVLGRSADGARSGWFPAKYVKLV